MSNNVIVNKTVQNKVMVEIIADLDGRTDLDFPRAWAMPPLQTEEQVLQNPAPRVVITLLKPGAITVAFRVFTLPGHNALVQSRLIEKLQRALVKQGVNSPIPMMHSYVRTLPSVS